METLWRRGVCIRIWDAANELVVAEIADINSVDWTTVFTEDINNLQLVGPVTWEFQAKTESGESCWVDCFWCSF